MKITTTLLLFLITTTLAFSQKQETIDSDRPGKSISPHTVGKNVLQIQTGFDYTSNFNPTIVILRNSYNVFGNETNVRFGLLDILEINGTIGYRSYNIYYEDNKRKVDNQYGAENLRIGTRVKLLDHDGLTPAIAASAQLLLPFTTNVYYMSGNGFEGTISIKQPITKEWAVTGNIGIYDDPMFVALFYPYTLNSSYSFTNEIFAFVEIFGLLNHGIAINYDGGIGYYLNNDFLLDISGGQIPNNELIYNNNNIDWYLNAGVTFRFGGDK
ncbi:MAG: transporter [Candidatus Kapaibacterium sp.]